jgi:hypothetical protein
MSDDPVMADPRHQALSDRLLAQPDVGAGTGFGSGRGLRVAGRIFAIFGDGAVTLKLPRARVAELEAGGVGRRFDPGHGRLMKEWLTVQEDHADAWGPLADEAVAYVRGTGSGSGGQAAP